MHWWRLCLHHACMHACCHLTCECVAASPACVCVFSHAAAAAAPAGPCRTEFDGYDEDETVKVGGCLVSVAWVSVFSLANTQGWRSSAVAACRQQPTTTLTLLPCAVSCPPPSAACPPAQVVMNGNQVPQSVEITQEAMDAGSEVSVGCGGAPMCQGYRAARVVCRERVEESVRPPTHTARLTVCCCLRAPCP
jgi:hypothetical protein